MKSWIALKQTLTKNKLQETIPWEKQLRAIWADSGEDKINSTERAQRKTLPDYEANLSETN